ncbi:DUF1648 domain-containing protein [Thermosipho ferrireducens]|uniref:DUF1648 domain-containing protein n=1 Tax=Thermosipho ferrireducens TaxID=2571116 RepID=A0ABX7S752_9BACT|nr:DUF1648 domain-containing protein [Thermosipho ferrireducens]QTA37442.1 DUF1648 domain-containing protein [Thermosipho ferrireducens]
MKVPMKPFSAMGKFLLTMLVIGATLMWITFVYFYYSLPEQIITKFSFKGEPLNYGSKISLWFFPVSFSITPLLIFFLSIFRFSIFNKAPYIMNLPAFYTNLNKMPLEQQSIWLNKAFEIVLIIGNAVTYLLLALEYGTLVGIKTQELPSWYVPAVFLLPILLVPLVIWLLYRLNKKMEKEIE